MNLTAHLRLAGPIVGGTNRIDLVAERLRPVQQLERRPDQSSVRVRFDTLSRFRQSPARTGSSLIQFSLDFQF
jgi:hypothetical protein